MNPTEDEYVVFVSGHKTIDEMIEDRFSRDCIRFLYKTPEKTYKAKKKFAKQLYARMVEKYRYHDSQVAKLRILKARAREDIKRLTNGS